ncbi:MAG: tRNA pseudouridine(55) synthase TruB [Bacteroidota bacterium]
MFFHFLDGEILLINKPYKWTSFDVVAKIRSMLKYRVGIKKIKIGHAGTLDPLATGLLVLCTGKFTKRIDEFQNQDKVYTGTFFIGATTPSFDLETKVNQTFDISALTEKDVIKAAKKFIGEQDQVPPMYSAIKIDGKRAYESARKGEEITIEARPINIKRFEIKSVNLPVVEFEVACSKGTYIRSLARDLGVELGCGAYLTSLCRTAIGDFLLTDAITVEQLEALVIHDFEQK